MSPDDAGVTVRRVMRPSSPRQSANLARVRIDILHIALCREIGDFGLKTRFWHCEWVARLVLPRGGKGVSAGSKRGFTAEARKTQSDEMAPENNGFEWVRSDSKSRGKGLNS